MRLVICLFATQNNSLDDKEFAKNFQLHQGAVLYLSSKLGAVLEDKEKQVVDLFATNVLKLIRRINMFNKKTIEQIIKDYKKGGILPELWGKDADKITNIHKIGFLSIFKKVMDAELKDLKKNEEDKLGSKGLTTDVLVVTWVDVSKSHSLTKEGLEYLKTYHPKWIKDKLKKGYFTWKLR